MTTHSSRRRDRIYGIDFSGAQDAGKKIWIAGGIAEGDILRIDECRSAHEWFGCGKDRDRSLAALKDFIAEREGTFGFDFSFGLPWDLVRPKKKSWKDFVLSFPEDYASPDEFRRLCREAGRQVANRSELKRITDIERNTPFSPYNLRIFRQTYYGIRCVLRPLVQHEQACVLPMQNALLDKPWILEVCPASTLKHENLIWQRYKRRTEEGYKRRSGILEGILDTGLLHIPSLDVRSKMLDDHHGDALDSVIAAFAAFRALRNPDLLAVDRNSAYALEGYVYV